MIRSLSEYQIKITVPYFILWDENGKKQMIINTIIPNNAGAICQERQKNWAEAEPHYTVSCKNMKYKTEKSNE